MRLQYKILWVDDNIEDFIELGIKDEFEEYLNKLAFDAHIVCFETAEKALEEVVPQKEKYDLILSDFNISGGDQGNQLIKKIRDGEVFTEILFYSAQTNFEEAAKNLYQDRVSFLSLVGDDGYRGFKEKVYWLVDQTISKLQEINNIRGLVMAETSSLDNFVVDILNSYFSQEEDETTQKLKTAIVKSIKTSAKGNFNKAEKIEELEIDEILKERLFDADKKARAIGKLITLKEINNNPLFENFYSEYKEHVLDIRNDLAHAKSDIIDDIEYLILSRKDGEHPLKWDQEHCIKIRKSLRKFSTTLHELRKELLD